ncbi:MAG: YvcK family protein [Synechococcales cyanobacterium RM1_1_8]|nr:YvcK family protein [Synechococcales cyanobacterium RM1_1_8]
MSNMSLLKRKIYSLSHASRQHTPRRVSQGLKWLMPGLLVKRWMMLSTGGLAMATLGLAIWANLSPVHYMIRFTRDLLGMVARVVPSHISGPILLGLGLMFVFWGHSRTFDSISDVLMPQRDEELVDILLNHRRLNKGPKIVVVGGGTGLSTLLRGLKTYSTNITAIVTVADDGGSSGRLRREMGVQPPGDIRNCLTALASEEKLLTELFSYRFETGDGLSGHSFGNLFLSAMTNVTGDFEQAIAASSEVLAVRGKVLPATLSDVRLWAELEDGRRVEGESNIPAARGKIAQIGCLPAAPPATPGVVQAIAEADLIVIGPGSLYTSIIPNLLVPEITAAIDQSQAPRIYIANVMTQPGETTAYSVADHIRAIDRVCDRKLFDAVLLQRKPPSPVALSRYAKEQSHPVSYDREAVAQTGRRTVVADVMDEEPSGLVRHNSQRLAQVIMRWYERNGLQRSGQPRSRSGQQTDMPQFSQGSLRLEYSRLAHERRP